MIAIIDADSLVWVTAYLNRESYNADDVINSMDNIITEILVATRATQYAGYIQGKEKSYRTRMFDNYKANRPDKPEWLQRWEGKLKAHAQFYWKFIAVEGIEADDAVASAASYCRRMGWMYTVVGNDKDLNQITGRHYNHAKKVFFDRDIDATKEFLLTQLLTGDSTDNIKGIPGIGPSKAAKILGAVTDPKHKLHVAVQAYMDYHSTLPKGLIELAENILKVTLRDDLLVDQREFVAVPDTIQQLYNDLK